MKPKFLTNEQYEKFISEAAKICKEDKRKIDEFTLDLGAAGEWIGEELSKRGVDSETCSDIAWSFGEKCFWQQNSKFFEVWQLAYSIVEDMKRQLMEKRMELYKQRNLTW